MSYKIAVYSIVKDEEKLLPRWYANIKNADGIYALDTGSTDNSNELLNTFAANNKNFYVFAAKFMPFRFDLARNFALNQISDAYDFALFIDIDEELEDGWYDNLQAFLEDNPGADAVHIRMIYSVDDQGNPIYTYNRLMVHRLGKYTWKYPVHEVLVDTVAGNRETFSNIEVYHRPDAKKKRDYMEMLRLGYEEYQDARCAHYYAKELFYTGQFEHGCKIGICAYTLEDNYLLKSEIASIVGYCFDSLGKYESANYWFIRSYSHAMGIRESWNHAAEFYFRHGRFHAALGCIENMLEIEDIPQHTIIRYDNLYRERPFHLQALCYEQLGMDQEAAKSIQTAFSLQPQNREVVLDMVRIKKIPIKTIGES